MIIQPAEIKKLIPEILQVHKEAFGGEKGVEIRQLVHDLFGDTSAEPRFSFVALENGRVVGHILFTHVRVEGASKNLVAQILAPLAVLPRYQNKGVGSRLIHAGLEALQKNGVQLVFVLGHPGYYPRCGFIPAGQYGFEAPYPIPEEYAGAWMVQELVPGILGVEQGRVVCSDVLNQPQHWRE